MPRASFRKPNSAYYIILMILIIQGCAMKVTPEKIDYSSLYKTPNADKMMYPYPLKNVWMASLQYIKSLDNELKESAEKTIIFTDESSGIITYTMTYEYKTMNSSPVQSDTRGWILKLRSFTTHTILIKSVDDRNTVVYYRVIKYYPYNQPVFRKDSSFLVTIDYKDSTSDRLKKIETILVSK